MHPESHRLNRYKRQTKYHDHNGAIDIVLPEVGLPLYGHANNGGENDEEEEDIEAVHYSLCVCWRNDMGWGGGRGVLRGVSLTILKRRESICFFFSGSDVALEISSIARSIDGLRWSAAFEFGISESGFASEASETLRTGRETAPAMRWAWAENSGAKKLQSIICKGEKRKGRVRLRDNFWSEKRD